MSKYRKFKIALGIIMIIVSVFNLYLSIKYLPDTISLLFVWIIVFLLAIIFLIYFCKERSRGKKA